jgi:hypothetical protein
MIGPGHSPQPSLHDQSAAMDKINMFSGAAFGFGIEVIADHIGGRPDPLR